MEGKDEIRKQGQWRLLP